MLRNSGSGLRLDDREKNLGGHFRKIRRVDKSRKFDWMSAQLGAKLIESSPGWGLRLFEIDRYGLSKGSNST